MRFEYDATVLGPGDVEALIARFTRTAAAMVADPGRAVRTLDVLEATEHAALDHCGNRAVLAAPVVGGGVSIPAVFSTQVAARPEAVALSYAGRSVTYGRLEEQSTALAHTLAGSGVEPVTNSV